ncbi:MAG: helix-turn-helix domain-containing protein [Actinoallomurus sp.]
MTSQTRAGNGRYDRDPETAKRDAEAAKLRSRGWTYQRIADHLGVTKATAHEAVKRALHDTLAEPAADVRELELARLDAMYDAVIKVLETKHVTVNNGRVIYVGDTPLEDDGPVLAAVDRLIKIQERRARLLGLDAKTQHDMGIAEREIKLAEGQGELLASAFFRTLDALDLSPEQQAKAIEVMPGALRAIEGGTA